MEYFFQTLKFKRALKTNRARYQNSLTAFLRQMGKELGAMFVSSSGLLLSIQPELNIAGHVHFCKMITIYSRYYFIIFLSINMVSNQGNLHSLSFQKIYSLSGFLFKVPP